MSIQDTISYGLTGDDGQRLTGSGMEVGNSRVTVNQSYPAGSTNVSTTAAFTAANVQSFLMLSSVDMTVLTNSTSAPGNTINLKAGRALTWEKSPGYYANPFTVNVTVFYISSAQAGSFRLVLLTS
jgi:hypothetical protein